MVSEEQVEEFAIQLWAEEHRMDMPGARLNWNGTWPINRPLYREFVRIVLREAADRASGDRSE